MEQEFVCPLNDIPAGKTVTVKSLNASGADRSRLYALGFTPGTVVEVGMECHGSGARRVRVRDCSVVLDADLGGYIDCVTDGPGCPQPARTYAGT